MMHSHLLLIVTIPGERRYVGLDVLLADLSKKLQGHDLQPGEHEVYVYESGAVGLDGEIVWQPKVSLVKKAG